MQHFIMLCGLPGSGKSTWVKKQIGSGSNYQSGMLYGTYEDKRAICVSSDAIRDFMGYLPGTESAKTFAQMLEITKSHLYMGDTVFYDATNLSRKRRIALLNEIKNCPGDRLCVLFVEPVDVCKKRDILRVPKWVVGSNVIDSMLKSFNVPMECEGFNKVLTVRTSSLGPDMRLKWIEESRQFNQENSHHTLSLYEHLCAVEAAAFEIGKKEDIENIYSLKKAALFHDIGKLWTKDFHDSKGNETTEAHYYNHENVGAYKYLEAVILEGTLEDDSDDLLVASLINWHMRPYCTMNPEKRNREREMLGSEFCKMLDILHRADLMGH